MRSSVSGSVAFSTGFEHYRNDSVVRACVDKTIKIGDKKVLRDILIAAFGSLYISTDLADDDLPERLTRKEQIERTLAFFGLEKEQIGFFE